ncbi:MAG: GNAT family N-acetyltransferase [Planctomycetota bacterium]
MELRFRRAEEADRSALVPLVQEYLDQLALDAAQDAAESFIEAAFDRATPGRGGLFVADVDGRVAGAFHLLPHLRVELGGPGLFIEMVIVVSELRGRGIGRRIFEFLADYAVRNRFRGILFEMEQGDPRLTEFLADAGYEYRTSGVFLRHIED